MDVDIMLTDLYIFIHLKFYLSKLAADKLLKPVLPNLPHVIHEFQISLYHQLDKMFP